MEIGQNESQNANSNANSNANQIKFVPLHPTNVSPYCRNRQNSLKGIRGTGGSSH